jgi:hypothetical protein
VDYGFNRAHALRCCRHSRGIGTHWCVPAIRAGDLLLRQDQALAGPVPPIDFLDNVYHAVRRQLRRKHCGIHYMDPGIYAVRRILLPKRSSTGPRINVSGCSSTSLSREVIFPNQLSQVGVGFRQNAFVRESAEDLKSNAASAPSAQGPNEPYVAAKHPWIPKVRLFDLQAVTK